MKRTPANGLSLISLLLLLPSFIAAQTATASDAAPRLIGEVFANGRQLSYVSALSDEIGSRLTGSAGARRAEEWAEGEMKRLGLSNVRRAASRLKSRVALVVPEGADLDSVIYNFYRAPGLVRELKDAGALAVLIAADKPHSILYTAPVEFSATGRLAALLTLSLAPARAVRRIRD